MTRDVPSAATRLAATARAMSFCSGAAQRSNSSSRTRFGATVRTIWGRSTAAGIVTGPTDTVIVEDDAGGAGAPVSA